MFLELTNRPCVVIGGEGEAAQKAEQLCEYGGNVTVFAPSLDANNQRIAELAKQGRLRWKRRRACRWWDLRNALVVVVASEDRSIRNRVFRWGDTRGRVINTVDDTVHCNAVFASIARCGDVQVAVSTAGKSPAYGQKLRNQLRAQLAEERAGDLVTVLGAWRSFVMQAIPTFAGRAKFWREVVSSDVPELMKAGDAPSAHQRILELVQHHSHEDALASAGTPPFEVVSESETHRELRESV